MIEYKITVLEDDIVVDVWYELCITQKGVEKKNKQKFKDYKKDGKRWFIEEVIDEDN